MRTALNGLLGIRVMESRRSQRMQHLDMRIRPHLTPRSYFTVAVVHLIWSALGAMRPAE
jgi:hypothetical protein